MEVESSALVADRAGVFSLVDGACNSVFLEEAGQGETSWASADDRNCWPAHCRKKLRVRRLCDIEI